ncbi:predicted protein [Nematostella vectensis]|uniref:Long-chain-fatty-acid--CoA ligase n=1 Tax=Nematostella vectensis TaxID=45351 RepID=A7RSR3_NEMVE|nr:predicted protein [Nematostella vectensis]|eukprot:XP_001637524.1 predicted protein [Nematostella vectensis]
MASLVRSLSNKVKKRPADEPTIPTPEQQILEEQSVAIDGDPVVRRSALSEHLMATYYDDVTTAYEGFQRGCRIAGDLPCLGKRGDKIGMYRWLSYNEVRERAHSFGSALVHLGCHPSQRTFVGIQAKNCVEWVLTDLACQMFSMVSVPIYDTHGPDACLFIINHADVETIVCNHTKVPFILKNIKRIPHLKCIIQIGELVKEEERKDAKVSGIELLSFSIAEEIGRKNIKVVNPPKPNDIFTICYTSGTTGTPKGAVQTHSNVIADVSGVIRQYNTCGIDVHFSYLPLAHAYERTGVICMLQSGCRIGFYRGDPQLLFEDIQELKPTFFASVPRIMNKVYDKVMAQVSESKFKSWMFQKGLHAKKADMNKNVFRSNTIWDKVVFKKVQMLFGGRVRAITSGAAPLSPKVMTFFRCAMGDCRIMEGYGQTECTACASLQLPQDMQAGIVGPPLTCNYIKLVDVPEKSYSTKDLKGEVCIKGPNVIPRYHKNPEKTAETLDEDGWLHTGDIGMWLENGALKIIDRKKDIFKLAQGEYVAPGKLENIAQRSPFVAQAFVHGESLKTFVVAILVPDGEVLKKWAAQKNIQGDLKTLCEKEEVRQAVFEDVVRVCKEAELFSFEQVKAVHLHPEAFSVENDLMTATFKIKRPQIIKAFHDVIESLYHEVETKGERPRNEVNLNLEMKGKAGNESNVYTDAR